MSKTTFSLADIKAVKNTRRKHGNVIDTRNVNVVQGTTPKRAERWAMRTGEPARTHYDDPVRLRDQDSVPSIPTVRQGYNAVSREFQTGQFRVTPP